MNSNKIESIGVTTVRNEINKYNNLLENFPTRDRNPVWDGNIEVYKKDSSKATDIVGIIPAQIKGKLVDNSKLFEEELSYNVKISDIENYRKINMPTIYFAVGIDKNKNTQIFYKVFDLKTIEEILEKNKSENRKTKRLSFKKLEKNKLFSICIKIIENLKIYEEIKPLPKIEIYEKETKCYNYNTKYEIDEIEKSNKVFFETNAYKNAKEKLEKQNIIILHGEPWVGKTTTARKLVADYVKQDYMFVYGNVEDLPKIKEQVAVDEKIICLLDDFLGSNVQYLEKNVADSTLDKIIDIFRKSKNKKLIFTTRTYIYNNAKQLFYKFHNATSIKDEYLIDVSGYTYEEKGNILYNHMKINNLIGTETHKEIVNEEFYKEIILNENFNPGVISLICERLKNKKNLDVKDYIEKSLKDPDELWEEEYKKLSSYEKIILIIIVLYGIKVPEKYVKEQFNEIIKIEKIPLLDSEIFARSLNVLSNSFIKNTFNDEGERELEVNKHSITDYIINKIKAKKINVERYIKSAKYAETLYYIFLICQYKEDDETLEKLAQKAEQDFIILKSFQYEKNSLLFDVIKEKINPDREIILKNIIDKCFFYKKIELIVEVLENREEPIYDYTKNKFIEYVIKNNKLDFIYNFKDTSDCNILLATFAEIFNYRKDTEYMIEKFDIIRNYLIKVISEDVENMINEEIPGEIAHEILEGKNLENIIKESIEGVYYDEITALEYLYSKKYIDKMLKEIEENSDIFVDEELLEDFIEDIEIEKEEKEESTYYRNQEVSKKQEEAIKKKFEKGIEIEIQKTRKKDEEYYDLLFSIKSSGNWWENSFLNENNKEEYNNLKVYKEFIEKNEKIDKTAKGLANQFLEYLLHKKYNISNEALKTLKNIAIESFMKNDFYIKQETIEEFDKKYLNELFKTEIIYKKDGKTKFINKYIHLYLAVNEVIENKMNLLEIMFCWEDIEDKEQDETIMEHLQNIFYLYSEINRREFNRFYLIGALKAFEKEVNKENQKVEKMQVVQKIINSIEPTIYLNKAFEAIGNINRIPIYTTFKEFINGDAIENYLFRFDYGIYQQTLYQETYNKENEEYEIDFKKALKNEKLKKDFEKLKIWDYLYDVYLEIKKTIEKLDKNIETDAFCTSKKYIKDKYFS